MTLIITLAQTIIYVGSANFKNKVYVGNVYGTCSIILCEVYCEQ